jgi:hypothetical protein
MGIHAIVEMWRKSVDKGGHHIKKNYAFSNVVVKFYAMFINLTCT